MPKLPVLLSLSVVVLLSGPALAVEPVSQVPAPPRVFVSAQEDRVLDARSGQSLNARIFANYTGRAYRLGPNDIVSVAVYDSPEFSQADLLVMPDGHLHVAPFGAISVAGLSVDELQKELEERLRYYLNKPQVTVKLEQTKPFQVYVNGAVLHPGAYEMVTDVRRQVPMNANQGVMLERKLPLLSNVLAAAGGLRYDADLERVKIHNKFDGKSLEVNLLELVMNGDSDQDLFLIAGDTVEVPKLPTPYAVDEEKYKALRGSSIFQREIPVKVLGFVNQPGLIRLEAAQSANLISAITSAGGYQSTDASYAPSKVLVSRVDQDGRLTTRTVDPRREDMALMPNDIVYVPSKHVPRMGRAFDYMARIIQPVGAVGNAINAWSLIFDPTRFLVNMSTRP